jgi:hypothetical protein
VEGVAEGVAEPVAEGVAEGVSMHPSIFYLVSFVHKWIWVRLQACSGPPLHFWFMVH